VWFYLYNNCESDDSISKDLHARHPNLLQAHDQSNEEEAAIGQDETISLVFRRNREEVSSL
jgi:hypothetical protein